ncbi:hypothetical protein ACFQ4C_04370 [Larkinella insperata]|uniref:Cytochrome B n=1 Tax=Larkinella insperata TaxID=332158 RepID=A0ABW3Q8K7_9BACT|nr:hypothetical protein [Larkinella insperata]
MYSALLFFHSAFRWLVLVSLLYALYRGLTGWLGHRPYSKSDNSVRHITATISHIQLMIGYTLYFNSPIISYFRANFSQASRQLEFLFFGLIHITLMTVAVFFITIGSAAAKRRETDEAKFKTMTVWFLLALLIIFTAIPWPFSPLANRPYFRPF